MIIAIVGSRERNDPADRKKLIKAFSDFYDRQKLGTYMKIISGGAKKGADSWAGSIAEQFRLDFNDKDYEPDFTGLKDEDPHYFYTARYYERNNRLAKDADVLIAVRNPADIGSRHGGTEKTIEYFKKHHPCGELISV